MTTERAGKSTRDAAAPFPVGAQDPPAPRHPAAATDRDGATHSAGWLLLRLLACRGVDYFLANSGTDFAPIVEALASVAPDVPPRPRPLLVPHESVAVGMAHGATLVTGRPQFVMVHVNVGTANALCGLINAARENVPMLLAAGRTPWFESGAPGARSLNVHWAQEMFDQAGMVREHVKWDYELRDARQLESVIDRALAIAASAPRGPVYLSLPREVLAQRAAAPGAAGASLAPAAPAVPDPGAIEEVARILAGARQPIVVTARAGADPAVVPMLEAFAHRLAAPVIEFRPRHLSLACDAPMHGGFEVGPWLDAADAILVLDCDVPWIPSLKAPRPDAVVIHAAADPLFTRYPVRGFRADIAIAAAPRAVLGALAPALDRALAAHAPEALAARRTAIAQAGARRRAALRELIESGRNARPMGLAHVSNALRAAAPEDAVFVNEYSLVPAALGLRRPGSFFGSSPAGGLGWGLPAALGIKLAAPDRFVVAGLGDGSYEFANPIACHHAAAMHGLPVLTVVLNNGGYAAIDRATRGMYPEGSAVRTGMPLMSLAPSPHYADVVRACDGHGERVLDPGELPDALARAVKAVRGGRQALVDIACA
ncbi:MAG: thiamine pyrophosphate-requiring protein [Burkholderiales bacterium]|nr:MAG: thiamine pyrophosphate-requiring protein [Burkholderiales bacterium]